MKQLLVALLVLIGVLFFGSVYFMKQLENQVHKDREDKQLQLLQLENSFYIGYKAGYYNLPADSVWNIHKTKFTK